RRLCSPAAFLRYPLGTAPALAPYGDGASGRRCALRGLFCWTEKGGEVEPDGVPIGERLFGAAGAPRVLIAEDEPIVRLDLAALLRAPGFAGGPEAPGGDGAAGAAPLPGPGAPAPAVGWPALAGVGAVRRIYAERPLPIVMLTAYSDRQTVESALAAGAFTY